MVVLRWSTNNTLPDRGFDSHFGHHSARLRHWSRFVFIWVSFIDFWGQVWCTDGV